MPRSCSTGMTGAISCDGFSTASLGRKRMGPADRIRAGGASLDRLARFWVVASRAALFMLVGPPVSALLWPTWQSLDADVDMLGQYLLTVKLGYLIAWPITLAAAVVFAFLLDPAYSMLRRMPRRLARKAAGGALAGAMGGAIAVSGTFALLRLSDPAHSIPESSIFSGTLSSVGALTWLFIAPGGVCGALVGLVVLWRRPNPTVDSDARKSGARGSL